MLVVEWVNPVLFTFPGGIKLYAYGAFIALALASCVVVLEREIQRLNLKADAAMLMLAFIPGFGIGSKAQMVVSSLAMGEGMPSLSLETGHSFMGSAVGGMLTAAAYGKYCGIKPLMLLDLIAPLVPLGHSVGKIGCFVSGDGCFGKRTRENAWWAMSFPNGLVPVTEPVHPTPLYECFMSGSLFLFLHLCFYLPNVSSGFSRKVGVRSAATLSLYGIERMIVEPFRRHPPSESLMGLTEYQFLAVIFIIIGIVCCVAGRNMEPWPEAAKFCSEATTDETKVENKKND